MISFRLEACACPSCDGVSCSFAARSAAQLGPIAHSFRFVRCDDCGLVYINPRVAPADIGMFYGEDYLPHVGERAWGRFASVVRAWQADVDRQRVRLVRRTSGIGVKSAALDIGCGRPTFLRALRDATSCQAVGIDVTDAGWTGARWPGLTLHRGSVASFTPERSFDVITMWHALEHEPRPREVLSKLSSWAHAGSALVVEVPDFASMGRRMQGGTWGGFHTPRHYTMFTAETLGQLVAKCGWVVERVERSGTVDPYVLWWLGREAESNRRTTTNFLRFASGRVISWPLWGRPGAMGWGVLTLIARRLHG